MIICQECGHENPFTTRFCRSCGAKLEVKVAQVQASVAQTKVDQRDTAVFRAGQSALTLCVFLLVCALGMRWMLVPRMPAADLPALPMGTLLPPAEPASASALTPIATSLLSWRHDNAHLLLSGLGVDVVQLQTWLGTVGAAQHADGSFPGDDPLAATGLAALALQAYPCDDATNKAAMRARHWLQGQLDTLAGKDALGRVLAMSALIDAEELPPSVMSTSKIYLSDGRAALWQVFTMAELPAGDRPQELRLVRAADDSLLWQKEVDLIAGSTDAGNGPDLFTSAQQSMAGGEKRMLWAFTAWHSAAAPAELTTTLSAWSRTAPTDVDGATAHACGSIAPTAVAILTVCAPARLQPLWFAAH